MRTPRPRSSRLGLAAGALAGFASAAPAAPQSVEQPADDDAVEAELGSFEVAGGFAVGLWADESLGVANPVAIRWDPAGRLWVLCTWAYPQLRPGERADDKLLILRDTDGDGRADETTVFADGLAMPTGFALGGGGAYVGQGADLLHLRDTDGDSRADVREVLFTGFGTGDTHQQINTFTWSPGGELLFCQGLHAFSRVETPWGTERLDEHGFWRLRPRRHELHGFHGGSGQNPWGIAFGTWGEPFMKGNGTELSELLPNLVHTGSWYTPLDIGHAPDKSMILEFADSPHLPEEVRGDVLIAGYFAHTIDRMAITADGAGHLASNRPALLRSTHASFRPVDIEIGPDGAIYVADWYNPIIGHYQASFRHPDRDKTHGRIWRIVAEGRPLLRPPPLAEMSAAELCAKLASDVRWVREQAKRRLADLPTARVTAALSSWMRALDPDDPDRERHLFEALGVLESHEVVDEPLLERLLTAHDARARAYATRVVGRWQDRIPSPLALLERGVRDGSARVRLEAVVASSAVPSPEAVVVATKATDLPMDRFLVRALEQCVRALAPHWLPALDAGRLEFERPEHLVFALRALGRNVAHVRKLLETDSLSREGRRQLLELLAEVGGAEDVRLVLEQAADDPELLTSLSRVAAERAVTPPGDVAERLAELLEDERAEVRAAALRLAGSWRQTVLLDRIEDVVDAERVDDRVRAAALSAYAELAGAQAVERIRPFVAAGTSSEVRLAALGGLSRHDLDAAVAEGIALLSGVDAPDDPGPVLALLMQRRGAARALAAALSGAEVPRDTALRISRWLSAAGHDDDELVRALKSALGIAPEAEADDYDEAFVRRLAREARESGDAARGRSVFESSLTNCTACHRVAPGPRGADEFVKGPDLTSVGAGLPVELLVEAVVWPDRQIKEGFGLMTIELDDGEVVYGYLISRDERWVTVGDMSTSRVREIPRASIEDVTRQGTAMPSGFTATLSRIELRDLIAYLASLKGAPSDAGGVREN